MVRLLNILQGGFGLVVLFGALTGLPLGVVGMSLFLDIFIAMIIAIPLREESPKGRKREFFELCISLIVGLGGLMMLILNEGCTLKSNVPTWFALVGVSLMLMNWGAYVGAILRFVSWTLTKMAVFLEIISGESLGQGQQM